MHRHTFPKSEHLLKRWEFLRVFDHKNRYAGGCLILHVLPRQPERKIGIIVTRKIGNAVNRNRARRLIKETYRLHKHLLPETVHLVITARPAISGLPYQDVETALLALYRQAKLL